MPINKFILLILILAGSVQASERTEYFTGLHTIFRKGYPVWVKRVFSNAQVASEERSLVMASRTESKDCVVKTTTVDFQNGSDAEWIFNGSTFSIWINPSGDGFDTAVGVILEGGIQKIEWSHHAREGAVTSTSQEILYPISESEFRKNSEVLKNCL